MLETNYCLDCKKEISENLVYCSICFKRIKLKQLFEYYSKTKKRIPSWMKKEQEEVDFVDKLREQSKK